MRTRALSLVWIALAGLFGLGCSGSHDGVEKRLAGLRDDITRLQAENDRLGERVDSLEARQSRPPAPTPAPAPSEGPNARAPLKVVKLFPGDAPPPSDDPSAPQELAADERPDAPGTRPVIRVRGRSDDEPRSRASVRRSAPEESP